jgi:hypothetical protein
MSGVLHLIIELSFLLQANGLYQSLDSRISSLDKLKQTETSQQAEATE